MKTPNIVAVFMLILFISCNKEDKNDMSYLLEGHWHAYDFKPDANSPADESLVMKEVIAKWANAKCDLIEFTFNADGYVYSRDRTSYVVFTSNDEDIEANCPTSFDDNEGDYNFDNKNLILNYTDGKVKLEATVNGDYLTTKTNKLSINGKSVSGTLFFLREDAVTN